MANVINWFEIPAKNFDRACKFYGQVLDGPIPTTKDPVNGETLMGFLPGSDNQEDVGGAIIAGDGYEPAQNGSVIYLNGGDDLSIALEKVEAAGGKILVPKTSIGENGFFAHFLDTEGNRVGFHSMT